MRLSSSISRYRREEEIIKEQEEAMGDAGYVH